MLTTNDMSVADMEKTVRDGYLCAQCQSRINVAWGGSFGINGYILRCGQNIDHHGITRHDKQYENKMREALSMESVKLMAMDEKQMMTRVEMARFPQELTLAEKKLLAQVAITYGFDPLMGEVSIFQGRPYVSIDGRYRKAQETNKLDGVSTRPATEQERKEWEIPEGDFFFKSEVRVSGATYPFVGWGRVFSPETQVRAGKPGDAYKPTVTNPQRMAEKRAEAQALRKAFHIPLPSIEDIGSPDYDVESTGREIEVKAIADKKPEKLTEPTPPAPPAPPPAPAAEGKAESGETVTDRLVTPAEISSIYKLMADYQMTLPALGKWMREHKLEPAKDGLKGMTLSVYNQVVKAFESGQ